MYYAQLINLFAKQKADLGMSESYIAERAGLSQPTVHRIFSGKHNKTAWNDLIEIGHVIGVEINMEGIRITPAEKILDRQAEQIATHMTRIMQATSQLEGQGLAEKQQEKLKAENKLWLLAGSRKKLWMEG